jgi:hypothetical protein
MYSIFKIIILSELKYLILSLFVLALFTGSAPENKSESQLYSIRSGNHDNMQAIKTITNKPSLQSGGFINGWEETNSPHADSINITPIVKDTFHFDDKESLKPPSAQISTNISFMNQSENYRSFNIYRRTDIFHN